MRRLSDAFRQPCYTQLLGPERKELERNLELWMLVNEIAKETGWSESRTNGVLMDIYIERYEYKSDKRPKKAIIEAVRRYTKAKYPQIPDPLLEKFLNLTFLRTRGKVEPIKPDYFKDLLSASKRSRRFEKYMKIFPYSQEPLS